MSDSPSPETAAPAPTGPDAGPPVDIALGPDPSIYPETFRPAPAPAAPPEDIAPEPVEATTSAAPPEVAGAESSPQEGETRGTRRRAAEDAYQRGLNEGRAQLEREHAERQQQDTFRQTQREANQRIEQLFNDLASGDYATQDRARQGILQLYSGNRQAAALMQSTRQQILSEMAADFSKLGQLEGVTEADYQSLHTAPSAAELAQRALDIGRKSRDDQVTRLQAELEGLRGRLVGSRATPEPRNGGGGDSGSLSMEQYLTLSPKDAAKLSSAQIDAITAQFLADQQRNGR